jgi:lysine-N-methylase
VLARRHVIDGQERVILHDQRRDRVLQIGAREWAVLEAADGTRDPEGIVVAARREGAHARVAAVRELLATLAEQGMLAAGEDAEPLADGGNGVGRRAATEVGVREVERRGDVNAGASVGRHATGEGGVPAGVDAEPRAIADARADAELPEPKRLIPLPGEDMRCDGTGTCCRLYGTVMLLPDEARRVRSVLPRWRVGEVPPDRWFSPMRGSEPAPVLAAIARDGACGFLRSDGLCAVHHEGGAEAKPWGCRSFPRIFVDDGVAVHVSAKPECPCMLDPRGGEPEPFVDPAWTSADALPSAIVVRRLPESIVLVPGGHAVPRAEARAWISAVAARSVPVDPAATLWALADDMVRAGCLRSLDEAWLAGPPAAAAVAPWLAALHERAAARAREHAAWRSEADLVRRVSIALATLTLLLREPETLAEALAVPPEHPEQEARYWRLGVHGYRWLGRTPLVTRLRDEALRLWLGRSLSAVLGGDGDDPHLRAPLALVEALLRAHGIGGYTSDVDQNV